MVLIYLCIYMYEVGSKDSLVLEAFMGSDSIEEKEDDCCHSLGPLLSHGDPQVRQAARHNSSGI